MFSTEFSWACGLAKAVENLGKGTGFSPYMTRPAHRFYFHYVQAEACTLHGSIERHQSQQETPRTDVYPLLTAHPFLRAAATHLFSNPKSFFLRSIPQR